MKKSILLGAIAALTGLLLAGCAPTTPKPSSTPTPTDSAITSPTLRVPETLTGSSATIQVNGGKLPKGTKATVYRFGGGWDGGKPTCDDPDAETRDVTLNGDGKFQPVTFAVAPGVINWVLVAGQNTTPCGDPKATTTVRVETKINLFLGGSGDSTIAVGKPEKIDIELSSVGLPSKPVSPTTKVTVIGPWPTLPEAKAASCDTAPIAGSQDVSFDFNRATNPAAESTFTPSKPGVYRVLVKVGETPQSTALDTCADDSTVSQPQTFVVTGG